MYSSIFSIFCFFLFFFFNDTATTEIYTLSLHDALPISNSSVASIKLMPSCCKWRANSRSAEHTSELQSRPQLVCRLLLEKKKHTRLPLSDRKEKKEIRRIGKLRTL